MDNSFVLSVGDSFHLRSGKDHIIYAGMPSDSVYSIVQKKVSGDQGYSWNLFYPKSKTEITVDGVNILVENVTSDEIRLRMRTGK